MTLGYVELKNGLLL